MASCDWALVCPVLIPEIACVDAGTSRRGRFTNDSRFITSTCRSHPAVLSVSWSPSSTTRTDILTTDPADPIIGQSATADSLHKCRAFPLLVDLEKEVPQSHRYHIYPLPCGFPVASQITSIVVFHVQFGAGLVSLVSSLKSIPWSL